MPPRGSNSNNVAPEDRVSGKYETGRGPMSAARLLSARLSPRAIFGSQFEYSWAQHFSTSLSLRFFSDNLRYFKGLL
jgi:hypothetical protein